MIPSKEELEQITRKLQKIMRIQDWEIEIKLCTAKEMEEESGSYDNLGNAYRNF